ncbi:MAG: polyamine aminopropyltransferase [Dehalococcoidia bacterium]|nr:polyamine aminopropyltransferase [Dehalococcoidia bacterium]MDH5781235.1 polyamine aminopropyltransferase [Dehalococcoidia bacterium]
MKDKDPDKHKWFHDYVSPDLTMLHSVKEVIYSGQSKFQSIGIINTGSFGICLILDGKIQSSEKDEFIYHEALVHPAMLAHPKPEKVFIAGGGEGCTLREVLAHKTVGKAVMVDIDAKVIDICRRFLPSFHQNSFDDSRAELHFTDARKYLEGSDDKFDVIIIDLPDPLAKGPARLLYTQEFYQIVKQRLEPNGIMSVQAESAGWTELQNFIAIANTLKTVFPIVCPYRAHIPSFADEWGFISASQNLDPAKLTPGEIDARISTRIAKELKSYDGLTHQAMFILPKHIRRELAATKKIITDKEPIFTY